MKEGGGGGSAKQATYITLGSINHTQILQGIRVNITSYPVEMKFFFAVLD